MSTPSSSSSNLVPLFSDPESVIQNRRRNLGDLSLLLDFEEINMTPNNIQGPPPAGPPPQNHNGPPGLNLQMLVLDLRTMEELCQPTMDGRGGPIAHVNIQATDFGLKNHMIQQLLDESLFKAWERYKLSIDRCPNHNMLPVTQIDTFYNGLTLRHRDTINVAAGGTFMKGDPKSGALPSNTVPNLRDQINSITTRSGLTTAEPSIPPFVPPTPKVEVEKEPETLMDEVPENLEDPRKFLIPCVLQDLEVCNSLAYTGASIIFMPLSIYEKLGIGPLKPNRMIIELASCHISNGVPISLGRPFLRTVKAIVDLYKEKLTLRVRNEEVVFYIDKYFINNSRDIQSVHCINIIDFSKDKSISGSITFSSDSLPGSSFHSSPLVKTNDYSLEEFADELALLVPFSPRNKDDNFDPEADLREVEYLLNQDLSTDSSPMIDIDIIDPILERVTDKLALVYSFPPGDDDDDLFDFKSANDEW
uniref:Reverse transcriptase domain-containing protein n=1 Tax=Tanacetum cinerariifolium TaxID=118510 RepID=A0A6L2LZB7_TANCI|nr:reverse transcriptase domain-containing protein [Tanacetum cinerariifolium]